MAKTVSAGILVKCHDKYVIGHVTGNSHYDIFKGRTETGESLLQTAIRECKEESSLIFIGSEMTYLGLNHYTPKKDLALFIARKDDVIIEDLICELVMDNGETEMDFYEMVTFDELLTKVGKSMRKVLKYLEKDIKSF
jgi:8-oxo-dGTP pyrophosphatase MutT (NUDIX family)